MGLDLHHKDKNPVRCDRCRRVPQGHNRRTCIAYAWIDGWHIEKEIGRDAVGKIVERYLVLCPACLRQLELERGMAATLAE